MGGVRVCFTALCVLISGCANLEPAQQQKPDNAIVVQRNLEQFTLNGRFSVRFENQNYTGRLNWHHDAEGDRWLLSSPFGQGMGEITTGAAGATLKAADGRLISAPNVEDLTRQLLGAPLPLSNLLQWVTGAANQGVRQNDSFGRLKALAFEDWQLEYDYATEEENALPSFIKVVRIGAFELRLRVDEWVLNSQVPVL